MSPILPENRARYPKDWKLIREHILERAGHACEFCAIPNYSTAVSGARVVLTIAHLDHTPENCAPENLKALCQLCHNRYDAKHRAANRKRRRAEKEPSP